jgi:hypothetical protein
VRPGRADETIADTFPATIPSSIPTDEHDAVVKEDGTPGGETVRKPGA